VAPTDRPRASDYVPAMITAIRRLDRAGLVDRQGSTLLYAPRRNVCTRNFPLGRDLESHLVPDPGAPPLPSDGTAAGFVLWRPQTVPGPVWSSPWGRGSPGWHVECYVMARRLLGLPVDLHGGGADLKFPHHFTENEVTCSLDGTLFSRSFLHLPFVTQNGQKMSKSTGNLVPISDALADADSDSLRWYLLGTPSTERLEWTPQGYARASSHSRSVRAAFRQAIPDGAGGTASVSGLRALRRGVTHDVADQIGVDRAIQRIERYATDLARRPNARYPKGSRSEVRRELAGIDRLLGTHLGAPTATARSARRSG
jgi:cysteinyl-tRNA synthetase